MYQYNNTTAALIGSRICHDLISPVGAVSNGIELMALSGAVQSPEMALVADSASNANARICLFRLAFGMASEGQFVGADEIKTILKNVYAKSRITVDWQPNTKLPRALAQAALLALLCAESAVGFGGDIVVAEENDRWKITAASSGLRADPTLWKGLSDPKSLGEISPKDVQFLLLPDHLERLNRFCRITLSDLSATIEY